MTSYFYFFLHLGDPLKKLLHLTIIREIPPSVPKYLYPRVLLLYLPGSHLVMLPVVIMELPVHLYYYVGIGYEEVRYVVP